MRTGIGLLSGGGTLLVMLGEISPWWLLLTLPYLLLETFGAIAAMVD